MTEDSGPWPYGAIDVPPSRHAKLKRRLAQITKDQESLKGDKKRARFSTLHVFRCYDFAKTGLARKAIARAMGIDAMTFKRWYRKHELFAYAFLLGSEASKKKGMPTYLNFVFRKLSAPMRKVWKRLTKYERYKDREDRIEALFARKGDAVRKHLYIHAVTATNFNVSRACQLLNINQKRVAAWTAADPEFADLLKELKFHQQQFYENALIKAAQAGEVPAIVFANRTFNADRGYGLTTEVKHTGTVEHKHVVDLSDLELKHDTLADIADAIRKRDLSQSKEVTPAGYLKDDASRDMLQCSKCSTWTLHVNQIGQCDDCAGEEEAVSAQSIRTIQDA